MNDSELIERIASLRRGELRKVSAELGIQYIHAEILEYLAICNKYSNTPLAVVEYLGQTKGSVSQSLMKMETNGLIKKTPSPEDKRSVHLSLTAKGKRYNKKLQDALPLVPAQSDSTTEQLTGILRELQVKNGFKGFSTCSTCRHNQTNASGSFRCGLTGESLTREDVTKICREHEYE